MSDYTTKVKKVQVQLPEGMIEEVIKIANMNFDEFIRTVEATEEVEAINIYESYVYGFVHGFKTAFASFVGDTEEEKKKQSSVSDFINSIMKKD